MRTYVKSMTLLGLCQTRHFPTQYCDKIIANFVPPVSSTNQGKLIKEQNIPCIAFFGELTLASRNLWLYISNYCNIFSLHYCVWKCRVWQVLPGSDFRLNSIIGISLPSVNLYQKQFWYSITDCLHYLWYYYLQFWQSAGFKLDTNFNLLNYLRVQYIFIQKGTQRSIQWPLVISGFGIQGKFLERNPNEYRGTTVNVILKIGWTVRFVKYDFCKRLNSLPRIW